MAFEDKVIVCSDCGQEFTHSADDQQRYAERGFAHEPKRCGECRKKKKAEGGGGGGGGGGRSRPGGSSRPPSARGDRAPRESFEVVCAACGVTTTVPFKPAGNRPVYCRECYRTMRDKGPATGP